MKYKYNNLSPGYLGYFDNTLSLNSKYYYHFHDTSPDLDNIVIFPQRIPRSGFLTELYNLETPTYRNEFNQLVNKITQAHKTVLVSLNERKSESNARRFINLSNLLMRYGCFEFVLKHIPKSYYGPFALEVKLIKESAEIENLLSREMPISIEKQLVLAKIYLRNKQVSIREKIILLNHITVNCYRHQKTSILQPKVFLLSQELLDLIQRFETNHFNNLFYCSVAYRGLAMAHEFGHATQNYFLSRAEQIANNIQYNTYFEEIVAKDNLFTCF